MKKFWTISLATMFLFSLTGCKEGTSELMKTAAGDTVIGMGAVFVILIFISFIISLFKYLPNGARKQEVKKEEKVETPVVVETKVEETTQEELSDDLALVAVISAAIAAYEGSTSTEGFVVRSIRKSNTSKWRNA